MTNRLTQLGVFALCVAAFVVLSLRHQDTGSFVVFVGPVLAGLFVTAKVNERSDAQDAVLAKISENTNGVLTKRIQDAVRAALAESEDNPNIVKGAD